MKQISRRSMLKNAAAATAVFSIVPRHVLGGSAYTTPSDAATRAILGFGSIAKILHVNVKFDSAINAAKIVAIADCDKNRMNGAKNFGGVPAGVSVYQDWREVIARKDVDFVHICTPPHWHGLMAIAAAEAGKDIYLEKPFTHTLGESLAVVKACHRNGTILRVNTWGRDMKGNERGVTAGIHCWDLKKLVESGLFGTPLTVVVSAKFGHQLDMNKNIGRQNEQQESVPTNLDYDMWLGPAPYKPYFLHRTHYNFRSYWDYEYGGFGDWGQHWLDPIQFFLGKDNDSPVDIIPAENNPKQHPDAVNLWTRCEMVYRDKTRIIIDIENKEEFAIRGPNGWLKNNYESNIPNLQSKIAAMPEVDTGNHNFMDCMKQRKKFCLNEDVAMRSCALRTLTSIAILLRRPLKWDPDKWDFVGDEEASRMAWQAMRAPWSLDKPMG